MKNIEILVQEDLETVNTLNSKVKSHAQDINELSTRFNQLKSTTNQLEIDVKKLPTTNNAEQINELLARVKKIEEILKSIIGE